MSAAAYSTHAQINIHFYMLMDAAFARFHLKIMVSRHDPSPHMAHGHPPASWWRITGMANATGSAAPDITEIKVMIGLNRKKTLVYDGIPRCFLQQNH